MSNVSRLRRAAALTVALALAGCAGAPPTATDGPLLARADGVLRSSSSGHLVSVRIAPPQVVVGQEVAMEIQTNLPGYLYVYRIGTDGRTLALLFPNANDSANQVTAGTALLPKPGWRMTAAGPAGVGYLLAVVAATPQDAGLLASQAQGGQFTLAGSYGAAMSVLKESTP